MKTLFCLLLQVTSVLSAQFLLGQSLEIELSAEGIVFPRVDTDTRDALNAVQGQCIYNIGTGRIECYDGVRWSSTLSELTSLSSFNRKDFDVLVPDDQTLSLDFGRSLDMYGPYIIVGDPYEDDKGAAYIYHHNGIGWEQEERLFEENGESDFQFGHSVSISDHYAIIGSVLTQVEGEEVGVVYIYEKDNQGWAMSDTLIAFDGEDADRFGESVMIHDDFIIVGASSANSQTTSSGKAYIYRHQNDEWLLDTFFAPQMDHQSSFGQHVAITEKYAIVSVTDDRSVDGELGSVFIYKRGVSDWELEQVIRASDGSQTRIFGSSIAIDGEDLIVGARAGLTINVDSSQVYYYQKNLATNTWEEKQIFKNPEGPHIERFGRNLSIDQNRLVILTQDVTDPVNRISQIRIYNKAGVHWTLSNVLKPFGIGSRFDSVLLYDDWLLLGSPSFSTDGILKGGVFIF